MKLLRPLALCAIVLTLAAPAVAASPDGLKKLLPDPLSGWKEMVKVATKVGKGARASAQYKPSDGPNVLSVTFDTMEWSVKSKKGYLADPAKAKSSGWTVVEIGGRKWLAKEAKRGPAPLHTLTTVAGDVAVTVQGFGDSRQAHEAYAKAIDLGAVAKVK